MSVPIAKKISTRAEAAAHAAVLRTYALTRLADAQPGLRPMWTAAVNKATYVLSLVNGDGTLDAVKFQLWGAQKMVEDAEAATGAGLTTAAPRDFTLHPRKTRRAPEPSTPATAVVQAPAEAIKPIAGGGILGFIAAHKLEVGVAGALALVVVVLAATKNRSKLAPT